MDQQDQLPQETSAQPPVVTPPPEPGLVPPPLPQSELPPAAPVFIPPAAPTPVSGSPMDEPPLKDGSVGSNQASPSAGPPSGNPFPSEPVVDPSQPIVPTHPEISQPAAPIEGLTVAPAGVVALSGEGLNGPFPPELRGWNWGAFFLNFFWGIAHNVWIALLTLVPGVNFIMLFVLGVKGNEWAWQHRRFESVAHFKEVQKKWAIAGLIIFIINILLWLVIGIFFGALLLGLIFGSAASTSTTSSATTVVTRDKQRKTDVENLDLRIQSFVGQTSNIDHLPPATLADLKSEDNEDIPTDPKTKANYDYIVAGQGYTITAELEGTGCPSKVFMVKDSEPICD